MPDDDVSRGGYPANQPPEAYPVGGNSQFQGKRPVNVTAAGVLAMLTGLAEFLLAYEYAEIAGRHGSWLALLQMLISAIFGILMLSAGNTVLQVKSTRVLIVTAAAMISVNVVTLIYGFSNDAPTVFTGMAILQILLAVLPAALLLPRTTKEFFVSRGGSAF